MAFDTSTIDSHMINKGRITFIQGNILQGMLITTQHNYGPATKMLHLIMPSIKRKCPHNGKSGGKLLRDGFCVFKRIAGLAFHSDSWTLSSSFSKVRGSWFFGLWTFWIGFTLDTVGFTDIGRFGCSFTGFGSVFLDVGLVFLLDFGLTYNLFLFAYIKIEILIEILFAFISFHRLLFNQLLGKLICI
jgi:hypothetical protein